MTTKTKEQGFTDVLEDDSEELSILIAKLREFESKFCEMMNKGSEFTVRLDIRGNKRKITYARIYVDDTTNIPQKNNGKDKRRR